MLSVNSLCRSDALECGGWWLSWTSGQCRRHRTMSAAVANAGHHKMRSAAGRRHWTIISITWLIRILPLSPAVCIQRSATLTLTLTLATDPQIGPRDPQIVIVQIRPADLPRFAFCRVSECFLSATLAVRRRKVNLISAQQCCIKYSQKYFTYKLHYRNVIEFLFSNYFAYRTQHAK